MRVGIAVTVNRYTEAALGWHLATRTMVYGRSAAFATSTTADVPKKNRLLLFKVIYSIQCSRRCDLAEAAAMHTNETNDTFVMLRARSTDMLNLSMTCSLLLLCLMMGSQSVLTGPTSTCERTTPNSKSILRNDINASYYGAWWYGNNRRATQLDKKEHELIWPAIATGMLIAMTIR